VLFCQNPLLTNLTGLMGDFHVRQQENNKKLSLEYHKHTLNVGWLWVIDSFNIVKHPVETEEIAT
jgi:hypothetical protein